MSIETEVAQTLGDINEILREISKEKIDPNEYTQILQDFTEEKKAELEALSSSGGEKTLTIKTIYGGCIDLSIWQEVWMKKGEIVRYGSFYTQGYSPSGIVGIGGGGCNPVRLPLSDEIEFDALYCYYSVFFARPKAGQRDKGGVSGSLDPYLFAFGTGNLGALGNGATGNVYPAFSSKIRMQARVKEMKFAGEWRNTISSFALLEDKSLWACGRNAGGEFGVGNTTQVNTWSKIEDGVDFFEVGQATLFFVKNNVLYACGANENGQQGRSGEGRTKGQVKLLSAPIEKLINTRYWNDAAVYGNTIFISGERAYGAGENSQHQIISTTSSNQSVFVELQDHLGSEFRAPRGADFASNYYTNFFLVPNFGRTDIYAAGYGTSGYGNSESVGSNKKRHKVGSLEGVGWKIFSPDAKGHGSGNSKGIFFIYHLERREIYGFGANENGALGVGDGANVLRGLTRITLPCGGEKQFEVGFQIGNTSGCWLNVVVDGILYCTGSAANGRIRAVNYTLSPIAGV